ncbi:hypothetical protein IAI10_23680 [Clostridium sp. 19966]|uniref:hypothetical protein n=1 Tax=Clostridium sp. 19966 TaxID=2768166 RepID=UPI0028DEA603|nr:hypothetical protein [Clostridium sp. 19966]MDT8719646.1 hypothetical protein [Clostridium sp. 19966]
MMKKYIKQELLYGIKSKFYYIILALLIILFGFILFLNYSSVTDTYNSYKKTESYYKQNGLDIQKDLSDPNYKVENNENGGTISNPILYHKKTVSRYAYAASPRYTLSQLMESCVLLFPIVFGALGLIVANNDFKYRTIKLKTVRMHKISFSISKQLSIAFVSLIILIAALLISYGIGSIMYWRLSSVIPIEQFKSGVVPTKSPMTTKFIFVYAIALLFAEIGYSLGILFKNIYVGIIAIVVYMFVFPNLGKFDLKNSIFYFQQKIFDFYGVISVESPKNISTLSAGMIILSIVSILVIANMTIIVKRSSFES